MGGDTHVMVCGGDFVVGHGSEKKKTVESTCVNFFQTHLA